MSLAAARRRIAILRYRDLHPQATAQGIADAFGVDRQTVYRTLPRPPERVRVDKEEAARMVALRAQGLTLAEIALATARAPNTVSHHAPRARRATPA